MPNLTPSDVWSDVYQLEKTDRVLGGDGGIANKQAQQLLNRTERLLHGWAQKFALLNAGVEPVDMEQIYSNYMDNFVNAAVVGGWSDKFVKTWSGKTQEEKNKYVIDARDFGLVADGKTPDAKNIQKVVDYAVGLRGILTHDVSINISGDVFLERVGTFATGWGYSVIVPSGVNLVGDANFISKHDYVNRTVHFVCRGSNINVTGFSFQGSAQGKTTWMIPVGGGTSYDSGIQDGTYEDIKVNFCRFNGSWISASFQCSPNDSGGVIFDGIDYISCDSYSLVGSGSAGNFNVRSDPPHKIRNVRMLGCTAKDGLTASSFNFVGILGGSVTDCTSFRNAYAACEVENGCEGIHISGLRSYDDAMGLWIDDSKNITFNNIYGEYLTDSMVSPLHGTLGAYRRVVMISKSGIATDENYKTTGIIGSNIVGVNATIYAASYGNNPKGFFGTISLSRLHLDNSGAAARGFNSGLFNMTGNIEVLSIQDVTGVGVAKGAREFALGVTKRLNLRDIYLESFEDTAPSDLTGPASLSMSNVSIKGVASWPRGHIEYSNLTLDGSHTNTNRSGSMSTYYNRNGSPEGNVTAALGSLYIRIDDTIPYFKKSGTGLNTGWKRFLLAD